MPVAKVREMERERGREREGEGAKGGEGGREKGKNTHSFRKETGVCCYYWSVSQINRTYGTNTHILLLR